ncbi:MAG: hypothetical protein MUE34_01885 [Acidimicrobiales bacterium]|jgi:hypothetical protein|nr:hypothetical protein [Acidimicrobiales bacterium]
MPRSTRLILSLLLALGVGMFVVATIVGSGEGSDSTLRNNPSVERVSPADGDFALQQARVLIDFAPGVNGELVSIGGVLIPTSAQSRTGSADDGGPNSAAPGGSVDGPAVWFTPGDTMTGADAIMDVLPLGEVCAVARYWPSQVPDDVLTVRWCFRVT